MGRSWTTKEQAAFLHGRSAEYKEASEKKDYLVFWDELFPAWFSAFPEPNPPELQNIAPELWSDEDKGRAKKRIIQRKAVS